MTVAENCSKPSVFEWNKKKLKAATLLAEDFLTDTEIAKKVEVAVRTLWYWKANEEFRAKIQEIVAATGRKIAQFAGTKTSRRVERLQQRWDGLHRVIEQRAADPHHQIAPGGDTGLLVRTEKLLGSGEKAEKVVEFAVDTGLLKEAREIEKAFAQECGQLVDRKEVTGPDGEPVLPLEALVALLKETNYADSEGQGEPGGSGEVPE